MASPGPNCLGPDVGSVILQLLPWLSAPSLGEDAPADLAPTLTGSRSTADSSMPPPPRPTRSGSMFGSIFAPVDIPPVPPPRSESRSLSRSGALRRRHGVWMGYPGLRSFLKYNATSFGDNYDAFVDFSLAEFDVPLPPGMYWLDSSELVQWFSEGSIKKMFSVEDIFESDLGLPTDRDYFFRIVS